MQPALFQWVALEEAGDVHRPVDKDKGGAGELVLYPVTSRISNAATCRTDPETSHSSSSLLRATRRRRRAR